jgi:hypothetical protein
MSSKKRKVKREAKAAVSFKLSKPGDFLEGVLRDIRIKNLFGKNKESEPTRMYFFEPEEGQSDGKAVTFPAGSTVFVTGKAMLDDQFDDIANQESGSSVDEPGGAAALIGQALRITRGDDGETRGGNTLGQYELSLFE